MPSRGVRRLRCRWLDLPQGRYDRPAKVAWVRRFSEMRGEVPHAHEKASSRRSPPPGGRVTVAPGDDRLGSLEAELLGVLWRASDWVSAPELHERLAASRPLAYTTVSTVLIRLANKGHVERVRDGRSFNYRAIRTKEQYAAARMARLLADLDDRPKALSWFLDLLDPDERSQLRRVLGREAPET